jgi:hypothetical protein
MKRVFNLTLGLAIALPLLITLGVQFLSGAPPDQEQLVNSAVLQALWRTIVVTSTTDSGPGTLRQALLDVQSGDTITFDPTVFPPTRPVTIALSSGLPGIHQGNLTIDASNAGVILDGSNIGTTPETLLLDDVSLTLDGGPNLIANGDFSAGLGHWRPWDEGPGATRSLNSGDFHSSPHSYAWSSTAQVGEGYTVYDTADTSDPLGYCFSSGYPFYPGSTVWITTTGNITAELRFWYRYGPVAARLQTLFPDGHVEQIGDWWFERAANWTEAVARQALPANARNIALELLYGHSESRTSGFLVTSNGNTIRGLQITRFPLAGVALFGGAQNNMIGGDRSIGAGPLGQGNLISGNGSFGLGLWDAGTSFNTIRGNYIGTDLRGATAWGSRRDGIHSNGANHNLVVDNLIGGHGTGVYLCCVKDGYNTVTGNYIGTDARGMTNVGNQWAGIAVDRSGHNMIGPANVVAHNGGPGIAVYAPDSLCNNITQNSIHDNGSMGIDLWDGGNTELAAPFIFDFDLGTGTVTGVTCANCAVEIFSDSRDEGGVYEGQTTADGAGAFTFNKGASFAGPHLTATTTDADGNTSEFSVPTSGTRRFVVFQEGNNLPKTRLQPKRSKELADNRIGAQWSNLWQPFGYQEILNSEISGMGLKRVRLTINEAEAETNQGGTISGIDWSKPELSILPNHDDWITSIADNGVTITYILTFWDKANHPGGWGPTHPRFKTEEEILRYLEYVRFIVRHFKDRVQYFDIWNEPDNCGNLVQCIEVADYINLVRRAVPIIHQEYPEAKVVVGSTTGLNNQSSQAYLFNILNSDIMPLVDVIAWHPMYGISPEHNSQYYYQYPSLVQEIKDVASAHGFKAEYRGDELTWRSPDCFWCYPGDPLDSNTVAAKYYARGIVMHLGMDVTAGTGGLSSLRRESFATVRNLCTITAGARPVSLPMEIQSEASNIKSYSFSLANGNHLVALWTDGIAVDDDPAINATLTIPGFSGQMATGIDVLYGFEQKLITSSEGDNLVIRDLMVKDYPIILRIAPTRYVFLPVVVKGYAR